MAKERIPYSRDTFIERDEESGIPAIGIWLVAAAVGLFWLVVGFLIDHFRVIPWLLALVGLVGCTSLLPMTHDLASTMADKPGAVLKDERATDIVLELHARNPDAPLCTVAQIKDPEIVDTAENWVPFGELQRICYPGVGFVFKAAGSFPLACVWIRITPWCEKQAILYFSWITDPLTMAHEREHLKGRLHPYWQ